MAPEFPIFGRKKEPPKSLPVEPQEGAVETITLTEIDWRKRETVPPWSYELSRKGVRILLPENFQIKTDEKGKINVRVDLPGVKSATLTNHKEENHFLTLFFPDKEKVDLKTGTFKLHIEDKTGRKTILAGQIPENPFIMIPSDFRR